MNRKTRNQTFDENENPMTTANSQVSNIPTDTNPNETTSEKENLIDNEMLTQITSQEADNILSTIHSIKISKEDVTNVVRKLAQYKDIAESTAYAGIAELFRRGGANAGASNILSVPVKCNIHKTENCFISKYDVINAMQIVLGHKSIRRLAETMAPTIMAINLKRIEKNPTLDLRGDLANRINRKLIICGQTPLTQKEQVCCCTYTQWMGNLNTLAESNRLKSLMEEDLIVRKKTTRQNENKKNTSTKKKQQQKKKKKNK